MNSPVAPPLVVFANFLSDLAVDLSQGRVLETWAQQAPRKVWLLRAGDVLVAPGRLSGEFRRYVSDLTGVGPDDAGVIEVPPAGAVPLADAVRTAGLVERVRLHARGPGTALLPTAPDASAIEFARELGITVHPYATADDAAAALKATMLLNTKAGFRRVAEQLGMRLPEGVVCGRNEVESAVRSLLGRHEQVVVKPDRSAGGHGMRFLSARDVRGTAPLRLDAVGGPQGLWVVEEYIPVAASVSVQMENTPAGPRMLFSGAMRTVQGSFSGYASPLPPDSAHAAGDLERWGTALGRHLADRGHLGPFGVDALIGTDGVVYAGESNVRRTATTTPHAMVMRLTAASGPPRPAWMVDKRRTRIPFTFAQAAARLRQFGLAFDPDSGEGVVLHADEPLDGRTWRYTVIAGHADTVRAREAALESALEFEPT
ncbi:peptide ligase PGM1-related protein [Streptomyces sp. NPDC058646]|uniref:preATP grasp domain-containing protein n=1 Tax=Streptomyces sp. NPDC058646 TaxID=3346574 RepID=UPI00365E1B88